MVSKKTNKQPPVLTLSNILSAMPDVHNVSITVPIIRDCFKPSILCWITKSIINDFHTRGVRCVKLCQLP